MTDDYAWRTAPKSETSFNLTDLGNAERMIQFHGRDLRYIALWDKWMVFDGKRWVFDDTGDVQRRAKETVRSMYAEAATIENDSDRKALVKHARASESAVRIKAMIDRARWEPGIAIEPCELDRDPWLLNCKNGTIDLKTGQLRPHDREDLITLLAPVDYDPDARAPMWQKFLDEVLGGDQDLSDYLRRVIGYALTGSTAERQMFIWHGGGANGKTTAIESLSGAMGDYAKVAEARTLIERSKDAIRNDIARLKGARLVIASENDEGDKLAEGLVKSLTGNETIIARKLYSESFEFRPTFKIILCTNHKPRVRGSDNALWDRVRLVPFTVRILPERQDKRLGEKLLGELPGILAWAVRGCLEWQAFGLIAPDAVARATGDYRVEMDVLQNFINDRCIVQEGVEVTSKEVYQAYRAWCEQNGEMPVSHRTFGTRLGEKGYEPKRDGRARGWRGIGLKSDAIGDV